MTTMSVVATWPGYWPVADGLTVQLPETSQFPVPPFQVYVLAAEATPPAPTTIVAITSPRKFDRNCLRRHDMRQINRI